MCAYNAHRWEKRTTGHQKMSNQEEKQTARAKRPNPEEKKA